MRAVLFLTIQAAFLIPSAAGAGASGTDVTSWAVDRIMKWSPPGKSAYPDAAESEDDAVSRYVSIARDAAFVAFDPEEPPLFPGPDGRHRTLALMLAVASHESGFRKDVDFGIGKYANGDHGDSWCLEQVRLGSGNHAVRVELIPGAGIKYSYKSGFSGRDLVSDRQKCFRTGLHIMRMSFDACRYLPAAERLALYASGSCKAGKTASVRRFSKMTEWLTDVPAPDSEYVPDVLTDIPETAWHDRY